MSLNVKQSNSQNSQELSDKSENTRELKNPEYHSPLEAFESFRNGPHPSISKSKNVSHISSSSTTRVYNYNSIEDNRRPPPVTLDPSIPSEVKALLTTNSCDLCEVKLNSRFQSQSHYEGKPHAKKLRAKLEEIRNRDKEILVNQSTADSVVPPPSKKRKGLEETGELYCKCCDLSFTSGEHAREHYLGRNHYRILHGLKPLKAGYYNKETGKWQRMPPDPRTSTEQLNMTDGSTAIPILGRGRFFCELCSVATTSQDQLDGHLSGQKHKKAKLKQQQEQQTAKTTTTDALTSVKDSILSIAVNGEETKKRKGIDLSIYRTPSGQYYCSPCNLTLNSESQFMQHIKSKKHKLKENGS